MSWGNPRSSAERALVKLLWPASFGLGTASYLRMVAYNSGVLKQQHIDAEIVSVGNLTCGGTGKTPVTIDLAQKLLRAGRKVAVLSRGYKRHSKASQTVVSNGRSLLTDCLEAGDEPYLIATRVPQSVVIVGAKRLETAKRAVAEFGCDTILLDDAFQHFAIARDTDIVLVDYNDDLHNDHLLPAGRLREPLSALARADWIVVTKVPQDPEQERLTRLRAICSRFAPQSHFSACRMLPESLSPFGCPDVTLSGTAITETKIFAFCGIARPELFLNQLQLLGASVVGLKSFGDHHWYTHQDIAAIEAEFKQSGAELVVTTEKDAVKLLVPSVKDLPLAVVRQRLDWLGPIPVLSLFGKGEDVGAVAGYGGLPASGR